MESAVIQAHVSALMLLSQGLLELFAILIELISEELQELDDFTIFISSLIEYIPRRPPVTWKKVSSPTPTPTQLEHRH